MANGSVKINQYRLEHPLWHSKRKLGRGWV